MVALLSMKQNTFVHSPKSFSPKISSIIFSLTMMNEVGNLNLPKGTRKIKALIKMSIVFKVIKIFVLGTIKFFRYVSVKWKWYMCRYLYYKNYANFLHFINYINSKYCTLFLIVNQEDTFRYTGLDLTLSTHLVKAVIIYQDNKSSWTNF